MSADRITGKLFVTRSEVISTEGMVAASHPLAAQIGIDILKKGGHLVVKVFDGDLAKGLFDSIKEKFHVSKRQIPF